MAARGNKGYEFQLNVGPPPPPSKALDGGGAKEISENQRALMSLSDLVDRINEVRLMAFGAGISDLCEKLNAMRVETTEMETLSKIKPIGCGFEETDCVKTH